MGNWKIEIHGHGIHHNNRFDDADAIARSAVRKLRAAGTEVASAKLTMTMPDYETICGDVTDLLATVGVVASLPTDEHILQYFESAHLPPHLRAVSLPFAEMAATMVLTLPRNPERTVALRKLLEAKDAAVRAKLAK
jgi:hypothetical protein